MLEEQIEKVASPEDDSDAIENVAKPHDSSEGSVISGVVTMRGAVVLVYEVQE